MARSKVPALSPQATIGRAKAVASGPTDDVWTPGRRLGVVRSPDGEAAGRAMLSVSPERPPILFAQGHVRSAFVPPGQTEHGAAPRPEDNAGARPGRHEGPR